MSRFNTLYHGPADDAADILDGDGPLLPGEHLDHVGIKIALTNALRRVAQLEKQVKQIMAVLA